MHIGKASLNNDSYALYQLNIMRTLNYSVPHFNCGSMEARDGFKSDKVEESKCHTVLNGTVKEGPGRFVEL